jgi:hypothetical protein
MGVESRNNDVPILVLVLLVDAAHEGGRGRQDLIDEDKDGLLGRKLDALPDNVDELAYGQVCRHQVLLLVDRGDVALLNLLADNLKSCIVLARIRHYFHGYPGPSVFADGLSSRWAVRVVRDALNASRRGGDDKDEINSQECGLSIFGGFARPRPCASRRDARP